MKSVVCWCFKATIAAICSLVLLSAFTLVYTHTGVHITNDTGATDYKWEPNQYKSTMSEGFSWFCMNEDGFNNSFNVSDVEEINILLMGSSHMEAVNVPKVDNTAFRLNNTDLQELTTYNIGMSGHTIYTCVKNMKAAVDEYEPTDYIIVETGTVALEEDKMQEVLDGKLTTIPSHDNGLMYKIQKFPCILPLYREIGNWVSVGKKEYTETIFPSPNTFPDKYRLTLNSFFDMIIDSSDGRKVILVYHPTLQFNEDGSVIEESDTQLFQTACKEHGIEFVDMFDDFTNEYMNNHNLTHGFINTEVGVGHLNSIGHKLIANRISKVIRELENGS